ncbi:MAG: MetQ/NlpA family ABC transporter substrate-binding protein [Oscillospiraceae bacterium]|nr:MetQ/NlpA family ABC transporter substrate-binding protein [Oscillospiraceae bacterium]
MKKKCTLILSLLLVLALLCACGGAAETGKTENTENAQPVKIRVAASPTPHAEILAVAAEILAQEGYELEIVEYDDYVQPNLVVDSGELDANYFQHSPYLESFNAENGTQIVSVGLIHYEPFGIYAGKTASLEELPDGAEIIIPNDGSNETRALLLLQQEGLIKLADGINASSNATVYDIAENPKNLKITEMDAAQLARSLPDVDLAVINGNFALAAGLNAAEDALAVEDASGDAAQTYANLLGVKAGRENDPAIQALLKALQSDQVRDYINENYGGAVVPIF